MRSEGGKMDDKIKVDEPLISTDVDRLIRCISEKKKMSMYDLQRECSIGRRDLDKWIRVLEDEGYITIQYGITGTYVLWTGLSKDELTVEDTSVDKKEAPKEPAPVKEEYEEADGEMPEDDEQNILAAEIDGKEKDPEEMLHRYVSLRRKAEEEGEEDLKSSILKNLDNEPDDYSIDDEEQPEEEEPVDVEEEREILDLDAYKPEVEGEVEEEKPEEPVEEFEFAPEEPEEIEEEIPPKEAPRTVYDAEVKDLLSAYVKEINEEKAKLNKLKREKEELYRDKMISLESRVESDLASLMQYVLEHEGRLLEMKERVLELPDKVEEVTRLQTEIRNLQSEGKGMLRDTKKNVDAFIAAMKKSEKALKEEINETKAAIEKEERNVEELKRVKDSIEGKAEKMTTSVDSLKERISELNSKMEELNTDLVNAIEIKNGLEDTINNLDSDIEEKENELDTLEESLQDIKKIEGWAREYLNDYEQKIEDVEKYVNKSDDELSALKEAAEANYMRKYLGELENITGAYENELEDVMDAEKSIESRMDDSRKRISEMVRESQKLIKRLRKETEDSPDYDKIKSRVERKMKKIKDTVEEKAQEGEKLSEEIKKKKTKRKTKKKKKK